MTKAKRSDIPDDCMPMCSTCSFAEYESEQDVWGCRRFPPTFISDDTGGGFAFPIVATSDWCGEFRRKVN